ncbi:MAG: PilZ domain-containing protein [Deltaproteobacteria bacterium]|nr:PilZ domain-containing protein [Deltaproteobacteria bacterium]
MAAPLEIDDTLFAAITESRLALRVPVPLELVVWDGLRSRRGEVLDISLTGARVRFAEPITTDRRPWIWLPAGLGAAYPQPIGVEVAWSDALPGAPTGHCQVGVRFRSFPLGGRERLARVLADLVGRVPEAAQIEEPADRRAAPRHAFERRIIARGKGTPLVLLGRDLSAGGLCVETRRALAIGDRLQLALHAGGEVPLVMQAEVVRAIGDERWGLAFREVSSAQQLRLEQILRDQLSPHVGQNALLVSEVPA